LHSEAVQSTVDDYKSEPPSEHDQNGTSNNESSHSKLVKKKPRIRINKVAQRSDTDIKCPECEFSTNVVVTWVRHLSRIHRTKPYDASFFVANVGMKDYRRNTFTDANLLISLSFVRELDQFELLMITPKCIICEVYPKSLRGYAHHLVEHHQTTMRKNGIYLICACGDELRGGQSKPDHYKKCRGREYSIRYLDDELKTTPKCFLCKVYPTTIVGYAHHIITHHKSTLHKNGIYLLCLCGSEVRKDRANDPHHSAKCNGQDFTIRNLDGSLFESRNEEDNGRDIEMRNADEMMREHGEDTEEGRKGKNDIGLSANETLGDENCDVEIAYRAIGVSGKRMEFVHYSGQHVKGFEKSPLSKLLFPDGRP
ncbi:hypothetical protein PMAYCL1PPCAC_28930, partial [Pristionchus mayeri]